MLEQFNEAFDPRRVDSKIINWQTPEFGINVFVKGKKLYIYEAKLMMSNFSIKCRKSEEDASLLTLRITAQISAVLVVFLSRRLKSSKYWFANNSGSEVK